MKIFNWFLGSIIAKEKKLICARCKLEIKEPSYVIVKGDVLVNTKEHTPRIFTCPEHAFNYAQGFPVHATCWTGMLKEYGVELYDLDKVYAEYGKKISKKNKQ